MEMEERKLVDEKVKSKALESNLDVDIVVVVDNKLVAAVEQPIADNKNDHVESVVVSDGIEVQTSFFLENSSWE